MLESEVDKISGYKEYFKQAMDMIRSGQEKTLVLNYLVYAAEKLSETNTVSSILVLDDEGLLRNGASPKLPKDYLSKIDGLKPMPNVGTCAAAAATSSIIVTEDFCADNKWEELRHLPLALGFKAAWSVPIIGNNMKVLGTFGTYFNERRKPSSSEIEGVELLTKAAAEVLR